MKNVLLIGKKSTVIEEAKEKITLPDVNLLTATDIRGVRLALQQKEIHHVIMGAGIEIPARLEIIDAIFKLSESVTIHLKDVASGPQGFFPFVYAILTGLESF